MYDHPVRQPGSLQRVLVPYSDTVHGDVDSRRQMLVMRLLGKMYVTLGGLMNVQDGITQWVVTA